MAEGSGIFTYQDSSSEDEDFMPLTQLTPYQQQETSDPREYHRTTRGGQGRASETERLNLSGEDGDDDEQVFREIDARESQGQHEDDEQVFREIDARESQERSSSAVAESTATSPASSATPSTSSATSSTSSATSSTSLATSSTPETNAASSNEVTNETEAEAPPPGGIPNVRESLVYKMMKTRCLSTYKSYLKTFEDFCTKQGITEDSPPTLEQVESHFTELVDKEYAPGVLQSQLSHLDKASECVWNFRISHRFPRVKNIISQYRRGYSPKQAKVFDKDDMVTFFRTFDRTCTYQLARAAFAAVCYLGSNRVGEIKHLTRGNVQFSSNPKLRGVIFTFMPGKQACPQTKEFFIPMTPGQDGIDYYEIFCLYWHKSAEDVSCTEDTPLWLTGRAKRANQVGKGRQAKSRFVNLPMGEKELAKTPRWIAEFLNLPSPGDYSGHSLRRSSASHMSAEGANPETLRRKHNWKSLAMAQTYVDGTPRAMIEAANLLIGGAGESKEEPPTKKSKASKDTDSSERSKSVEPAPDAPVAKPPSPQGGFSGEIGRGDASDRAGVAGNLPLALETGGEPLNNIWGHATNLPPGHGGMVGNLPLAPGGGIAGNPALAPGGGIAGNLPLAPGGGIAGNLPLAPRGGIAGNLPLAPGGGAAGNLPLALGGGAAGNLPLAHGGIAGNLLQGHGGIAGTVPSIQAAAAGNPSPAAPPGGPQPNSVQSPFDLLRQHGINIELNFNFGNMPSRT